MLNIPTFITLLPISFYLIQFKRRSSNVVVTVASGVLYSLIIIWENYVTKIVPDPYLVSGEVYLGDPSNNSI